MTLGIQIVAALLLIVSQVWLVVLAYKRGGAVWAVMMTFFSLIVGLVFCLTKKEGWLPLFLNFLAWIGAIGLSLRWF